MKKIFFVLAIALCTASSVFAEDMKVMALKDFSTDKPSEIKVQGIGTLLYNNMSLNKMPYDELEDLLELLSN